MTNDDEKEKTTGKSFWSTLPGILTGIATLITATVGAYIAINQSQSAEDPLPEPLSVVDQPQYIGPELINEKIEPSLWPIVGEDAFLGDSGKWWTGDQDNRDNTTGSIRVVGGSYRWSFTMFEPRYRYLAAPYGPVNDFFASVDLQFVEVPENGWAYAGIILGQSESKEFYFRISENGYYSFQKFNKESGGWDDIVIWTPFEFDPDEIIRVSISSNDQLINPHIGQENIGQFIVPDYFGGHVGLFIGSSQGSTVVDFNNFELRKNR